MQSGLSLDAFLPGSNYVIGAKTQVYLETIAFHLAPGQTSLVLLCIFQS